MTTIGELSALLLELRDALAAAAAPTVALGQYVPERRVLGFPRAERVQPTGHAWRLGTLLLTDQAELFTAGTPTRAKRPVRVGYTSESARARDALRAAASKGGYADGALVHVDPVPLIRGGAEWHDAAGLPPNDIVKIREDGALVVAWAPGAAGRDIAEYLTEHAQHLVERAGSASTPGE